MSASWLHLRWRAANGNGQVTAFREEDGQMTQIGEPFGEQLPYTDPNYFVEGQIAHWGNKLYAMERSGIYEWDIYAGGPWTLGYTFSALSATAAIEVHRMAFTPCAIDGSGVLVTAYATATNDFRVVKIDLDGNYSEGPTTTVSTISHLGFNGSRAAFQNAGSYRNSVFFADNRGIVEYDLKQDTLTGAGGFTSNNHMGICVYRDKIFFTRAGSSFSFVYRKDGSNSTFLGGVSLPGPHNAIGKSLLFPSGDSMIWFTMSPFNSSPDTQPRVIKVDFPPDDVDNISYTDISEEVWGSGYSTWFDTSRASADTARLGRFHLQHSIGESGISDPLWRISLTRYEIADPIPGLSETEQHQLFYFNPPVPTGAVYPRGGVGNTYGYSYINTAGLGNGAVFQWPGSGTLNVSAPRISLGADNESFDATFKVYGPNVSGVALRTLVSLPQQHTLDEAIITSTSIGALSGNVVTGIPATPGGTEVTVNWAAVTEGVTITDNPRLAARAFLP